MIYLREKLARFPFFRKGSSYPPVHTGVNNLPSAYTLKALEAELKADMEAVERVQRLIEKRKIPRVSSEMSLFRGMSGAWTAELAEEVIAPAAPDRDQNLRASDRWDSMMARILSNCSRSAWGTSNSRANTLFVQGLVRTAIQVVDGEFTAPQVTAQLASLGYPVHRTVVRDAIDVLVTGGEVEVRTPGGPGVATIYAKASGHRTKEQTDE